MWIWLQALFLGVWPSCEQWWMNLKTPRSSSCPETELPAFHSQPLCLHPGWLSEAELKAIKLKTIEYIAPKITDFENLFTPKGK